MSFLNKLIESAKDLGDKAIDKAKDLGDKAADQIEIQKLRSKISAQEKEISAIYEKAGKAFLEEHEGAAKAYFTEELEKIKELKLGITALEAEIELIKDKNVEDFCEDDCESCEACELEADKKVVCEGNVCKLVEDDE